MYQSKNAVRWLTTALVAASAMGAGPAFAQLSVTLDGGALTLAGADGVYDVKVQNAGATAAANVVVSATLPTDVSVTKLSAACVGPVGADGGPQPGFPCTIASVAAGGTSEFTVNLNWAGPATPPTACNTALDLTVSVPPGTGSATATLPGLTMPYATLSMTDPTGPAFPPGDGGTPADRPVPGGAVTYKSTLTNGGPCQVGANLLTIDASPDTGNNAISGLIFTSGAGDCSTWADGVCTYQSALANAGTVAISVSYTIAPLSDAGGDSIIQSASFFQYAVQYGGNIGATAAPAAGPVTTLVKGPASSCAATGGFGFSSLAFLAASFGLVLALRRRR